MKHYRDAIIHGAQLFRYLKAHQTPNSNELSLAKIPLAAARTAARTLISRHLQDGEGGGEDAFFGSAFGGGGGDEGGMDLGMEQLAVFTEKFEECGIDMEDMMTKAMGAYFLYGADLANVDPTNPDTFPGVDTIDPFLVAFKDDDEKDCSDAENEKLVSASKDYLQCSGFGDFFDLGAMESGDISFLTSMEDECSAVFNLMQDESATEDELDEAGAPCMKNIFSGPIGDLIRWQYHNMDKMFECIKSFGEDLPHCIASTPAGDDGEKLTLPLSLEKKVACVLGSSYEGILKEACVGIFEALDECLPLEDFDGEETIPFACGEDMIPSGMDSSVITGNEMPGFCTSIYDESGVDAQSLVERLESYNEHREYGWTLVDLKEGASEETFPEEDSKEATPAVASQEPENHESTAHDSESTSSVVKEATPAVPSEEPENHESTAHDPESTSVVIAKPAKSYQEPEGSKDYESNPVDIESVESAWEDGESEDEVASETTTTAKSIPFVVVGLAGIAALVVALIVKFRKRGAVAQRPQSVKDYSDLTFRVDDEHDLA